MPYHVPRLRKIAGGLSAAVLLLMSVSPADAIHNLVESLAFFGFATPEWFSPEKIEPFARLTLVFAAFALVVWVFWPVRGASGEPAPINTPLKHWFDVAIAPFRLPKLPQFEAHGNFWDEDTLKHYLGEWEEGEFTNCAGVAFDRGVVDWRGGYFMFYWADGTGIGDRPWLIGDLNETGLVSIPPKAAETIRRGAAKAWELMNEPIQQHLDKGKLRAWARIGSPMAPFSVIPPDSWRHYVVENWERGEAVTSSGDRLYSVHFEAISPDAPPARRWRLSFGSKKRP